MKKIILILLVLVSSFGFSQNNRALNFMRGKISVNANFEFQIDTRNLSTESSLSNQYKIPLVTQQTEPITVNWGDGNSDIITTWNQAETTHTYAVEGVYNISVEGVVNGFQYNNSGDRLKQLDITNWGEFNCLLTAVFHGCVNLTSLAEDIAWINSLVEGREMFRGCSLTGLPTVMELPVLTSAFAMFYQNSLTSLPNGMQLPLLTSAFAMFRNNSLTSLPNGMQLPVLTNGNQMFRANFLTSLPDVMELPLLTNGSLMFYSNSLTSLPDLMELPLLTNGNSMFRNNTINTTRYSQLLIDLKNLNTNDNINFGGGNSKYNSAGEIARNALIARGWIITDDGLE